MRSFIVLLTFQLFFVSLGFGQNATVFIDLKNASSSGALIIRNNRLVTDHFKKSVIKLNFNKSHVTKVSIILNNPQFVTLTCGSKDSLQLDLQYQLFLSPGDEIYVRGDLKKKDFGLSVSGKGSNNNQPLSGLNEDFDLRRYYGDTLPDRIISDIVDFKNRKTNNLMKYIKLNHPTRAYIEMSLQNLAYEMIHDYFLFKEGNRFKIKFAYKRNYKRWQSLEDSLMKDIKIDNPDALGSYLYREYIGTYLFRTKEKLWEYSNMSPENFYKEWYSEDSANAKSHFNDDPNNLLQEKIIRKYFKGRVAEYLYAVLFDMALDDSDYQNMLPIYNRFALQFPNSEYLNWLDPEMSIIKKKQSALFDQSVVFAKDNGLKINRLDEVLETFKGKTILLDLWGTWCGPCRSEFEKNLDVIKRRFKNFDLTYIYIANLDVNNQKKWRELISYYKLPGFQVLANENLTIDLRKSLNFNTYPANVIIHKDGSYEMSKAGYPMDRKILIDQIEKALSEK